MCGGGDKGQETGEQDVLSHKVLLIIPGRDGRQKQERELKAERGALAE